MGKLTKITPSMVARQTVGWSFSASYLPIMAAVCGLTSKAKRASRGPAWVRGWGRTMSRIAGVEVLYTEAARAALDQRMPRVLTFNHGSTLDVLVGASLLPDGGVLIVKEEMRQIPFMGAAAASVGSVFLERGDRERAYASLRAAAQRIVEEELQVLISPEGTRAGDGRLGRFKLGAFHLAHIAQVPILPVVMRGNAALWPPTQLAPTRGTVTVDVLPEYRVNSGDPDGLRAAADTLRDRYMATLSSP